MVDFAKEFARKDPAKNEGGTKSKTRRNRPDYENQVYFMLDRTAETSQGFLLNFYLSTSFNELSLDGFSFFPAHFFFDWGRSFVHDVFSLFQAKAGDVFDHFHHIQLTAACADKDHIELSLLSSSGSTAIATSGRGSHSHSGSSRLNAVIILEDASQFIHLFDGEVNQLFCESFQICHRF